MKKLLVAGVALYLLSSASAFAGGLNVQFNVGASPYPAYYVPSYPVYVVQQPGIIVYPWVSYDPQHRVRDWRYWQERRQHERWEHEHGEREHPHHR